MSVSGKVFRAELVGGLPGKSSCKGEGGQSGLESVVPVFDGGSSGPEFEDRSDAILKLGRYLPTMGSSAGQPYCRLWCGCARGRRLWPRQSGLAAMSSGRAGLPDRC